jgi:hypothetical protein
MDYADRRGLDPDRLKRIMWAVDGVLLEHWEGTDEAAKRQAEFEAEQKRRIPGART